MTRGIQFGEVIHIHPYHWDAKTERLELVKSTWKKLLWYFNVCLTFAYGTFVSLRCGQTNISQEESDSRKIYMRCALLYYNIPVLFQIMLLWKTEDIPDFFHKYTKNMEKIDG